MQRRLFIRNSLLGASAALLAHRTTAPLYAAPAAKLGKHEPFKGIFPIMQTPFRDDEEIDVASMARQVNFIIEAGGGGMVWPQLASEFFVLTNEERMRTSELIVDEARGRLPVVVGVQSTNFWKPSVELAEHAQSIGADAIISLPPYAGNPSVEEAAEYYRELARAVSLPIFIQNSGGSFGPALPTETVVGLAKEYPNICYIKEEAKPVTHRIGEMVAKGGDHIKGVFSGAWGTTLLNELRRGCRGTMPGSSIVDVYAEIFDSFLAGDKEKAQTIFDKVVSLVTFKKNFSVQMEKVILKRRGIFESDRMRTSPHFIKWDDTDREEFEVVYGNLKPYFKARG